MLMKAVNATIYPAIFSPSSDSGYEVSFPDFPGCITFGYTFEEAREKASEVLSLWIEELEAEHVVIPKRMQHPIIIDVTVALAKTCKRLPPVKYHQDLGDERFSDSSTTRKSYPLYAEADFLYFASHHATLRAVV